MTDPTAPNFKPGDRVWFVDSPVSKRSGSVLAATPMISNEHVPIVMDDNGATCHVHRSHVFAADPTAEPDHRDPLRAWCEIHNQDAATCDCPEWAYEARHAHCATAGGACIAHFEKPSTPEVATAEPDQSCCVNTLREAANEVREVSLEAADILVERARDLEKLIKETPVPAEPSQRVKYRAKIAAIIDEIGDYPFAATDEILAVRDTEMEQFVDFAGEQSNRVRELEAELARLRAEVAELAGLRERAIILPNGWQRQISDGLNVGHAYFPSTRMIGLVESWRAAPEPAPPPRVPTIVDRATGERHEYPQQEANERACECGHPVSGHGCEGCVHLVDGEYCQCMTPYGGDTEEDTDA